MMMNVTDYIREQVEAILKLSNCMVLYKQPFSNYFNYYLIDWETEILVDHVELRFQDKYFSTEIRSERSKDREGVLPNGLGMIYYNEDRENNLSKLRKYFGYMKQKFIKED